MALVDGQAQIRDLVIGKGTKFDLHSDFDPFSQSARADQSGPRAWNHGSWSGAEWAEQKNIPFTVTIHGDSVGDVAGTIQRRHQLQAAFAPVGDTAADVQLRFHRGGVEYVLFGRPRRVEVDGRLIGTGKAYARCLFVALDPFIYSGDEIVTGPVDLPITVGGLTAPLSAPVVVSGMRVGGSARLSNIGTAEAGLLLTVDGPVPEPRVTLQRADGLVQTLRALAGLDIPEGQSLVVDTKARTVLLNGSDTGSRLSQVAGEFPLLPPGVSTLRFDAAEHDSGTLTCRHRSVWW